MKTNPLFVLSAADKLQIAKAVESGLDRAVILRRISDDVFAKNPGILATCIYLECEAYADELIEQRMCETDN